MTSKPQRMGYRETLDWLLDNEDLSYLDEGDPEPVTVALAADIFGKTTEQVSRDLDRRRSAPRNPLPRRTTMEATTTTADPAARRSSPNPFTRYAQEARDRSDGDTARRITAEGRIVHKLVTHALASGYVVSVDDGEEWVVKRSTNIDEIINACASTDSDRLRFHNPRVTDETGSMLHVGTVVLIYGNGSEVISDYSAPDLDAFSAWMKPVEDFAEEA